MKNLKNKKKGFTFLELVIVMAVMTILLMIGMPKLEPFFRFNKKVDAVTTHKIIISAINQWISDNTDPGQRPSDINSVNSQGRRVYDFIDDKDLMSKITKSDSTVRDYYRDGAGRSIPVDYRKIEFKNDMVVFKDGILRTDPNNPNLDLVYSVFPLNSGASQIKDYDYLVNKNIILTSPVHYLQMKI